MYGSTEIIQERDALIESITFVKDEITKTQKNKTMLKSAIEKVSELSMLNTGIRQLWESCLPLIQTAISLVQQI